MIVHKNIGNATNIMFKIYNNNHEYASHPLPLKMLQVKQLELLEVKNKKLPLTKYFCVHRNGQNILCIWRKGNSILKTWTLYTLGTRDINDYFNRNLIIHAALIDIFLPYLKDNLIVKTTIPTNNKHKDSGTCVLLFFANWNAE